MDNAKLTASSDIYSLVRAVQVRPVEPEEITRWASLMAAHHYLGAPALVGESLRYVATIERKWVALLGWSSAALKCGPRDRWIGWPAVFQWQRLSFIANNSRFLILPEVHIPNLASRILSLNTRRLSEDWQRVHGHSVLLVETFVDPSRFSGTCYKAAGWIPLGQTRGFAKNANKYWHHGNSKIILTKTLHRCTLKWLTHPFPPAKLNRPMKTVTIPTSQMDDLRTLLKALPEYRMPRGSRHSMACILSIAICAILAGARSFIAIGQWSQNTSQATRKRLRCWKHPNTKRFGAPSESTIRRVIGSVDAAAVDNALGSWFLSLAPDNEDVAIDGKALRGAKQENGKAIHLMSAFLHQQGYSVAQVPVDSKSNEITAVRPLLSNLNLAGRLITADALHTQKNSRLSLLMKKKPTTILPSKTISPI